MCPQSVRPDDDDEGKVGEEAQAASSAFEIGGAEIRLI